MNRTTFTIITAPAKKIIVGVAIATASFIDAPICKIYKQKMRHTTVPKDEPMLRIPLIILFINFNSPSSQYRI
jgi:flagellar biosynthesis protein FliP